MEGETLEKLIIKRFKTYEDKCKEEIDLVEEALGRPHILLDVALPEGCDHLREEFEKLPEDCEFREELQSFIRDVLMRRASKQREEPSEAKSE